MAHVHKLDSFVCFPLFDRARPGSPYHTVRQPLVRVPATNHGYSCLPPIMKGNHYDRKGLFSKWLVNLTLRLSGFIENLSLSFRNESFVMTPPTTTLRLTLDVSFISSCFHHHHPTIVAWPIELVHCHPPIAWPSWRLDCPPR